jgi:serine/threonine protein kinase
MANPLKDTRDDKHILLSGPGDPEPEPPQIDGYEILEFLGAGGMGIVWRAKQLGTNRQVALKVLNQSFLRSKGRAKIRFEREVTIAARLEHQNIARVYESGIHKNHYFYVMELIQGESLNQYVQHQKLSAREILQLMHKVCLAVQHAHQNGIIHRDLKHSNIMVTPGGQPLVLDFGLALDLFADDSDRKVSLDGDVMGTPEFMSPEQAAGDIDLVDTRSDVYSLGVIMYELLINKLPYDLSGQHYKDLKMIQEQEPTRPSSIFPRFDKDLEAILLKTLSKTPHKRYRSAGELADDIERWLTGLPVKARSIDRWYVIGKFIRRNRVAVTVGGLLIVIILSTGFIGIYSYTQAPIRQRELENRLEIQKEEMNSKLDSLNKATFWLFLEHLQLGNIVRARQSVAYLFSHERSASIFLLDSSPTDEKIKRISTELGSEYGTFWLFVIGESYLKDSERKQAVIYYKQSIENSRGLDGPSNEWAAKMAESRLKELENQKK